MNAVIIPMKRVYQFNFAGKVKAVSLSEAVSSSYGEDAILGIARSNRHGGGVFNIFQHYPDGTPVLMDFIYLSTGEQAGFPPALPKINPHDYEVERLGLLLDYIDNPFSSKDSLLAVLEDEKTNPDVVQAVNKRLNNE